MKPSPPLALLLGLALTSAARAQDSPAESYRALLERYGEARAIHLSGQLEAFDASGAEPERQGGAELEFRFMKPLRGRLQLQVLMEGSEKTERQEILVDGRNVHLLTYADRSYVDLSGDISPLASLVHLDPVLVWAGVERPEPLAVEFMDASEEGWSGLLVRHADASQELWLGPEGRIRRARIVPAERDAEQQRPVFRIEIAKTELLKEANPEDYAFAVPEDFRDFAARTGGATERNSPLAGKAAPDVQLVGADGERFALSTLRGKTVLLNFWFYH